MASFYENAFGRCSARTLLMLASRSRSFLPIKSGCVSGSRGSWSIQTIPKPWRSDIGTIQKACSVAS
jgi:hypothetical protein